MSRRKSRIFAFQSLYSIDVGNIPLEDALKFDWNESDSEAKTASHLSEKETLFARNLVAGTVENLNEIDSLIKDHLTTWDFERINKVTLSILRMSVYSLLYQDFVESSIVIDEAVQIAREYGPDDSYKFINAMLDNIRRHLDDKKSDKKADN